MTQQKITLGRWGEDIAAKYLADHGYEIIERNVRTEHGEIDIVARKEGQLVFVEVKARSSGEFGHPEESVTELKQQHLADSAHAYLQSHPELDGDWRVDVIAILRRPPAAPEIVHFEDALGG